MFPHMRSTDIDSRRIKPAALDIAKATRRAHGTRFPVKPSLSGISVDPPTEGEEKSSASSNGRAVHEPSGPKLGPPIRTVSFETPTSAINPINAPPIPPRSESRLNSHSTSLSPERTTTISPPRPYLSTDAADWGIDQPIATNSERSHTDSVLQTSSRSNRQARVWRETQNYKDTRHARRGSRHPSRQTDMAYPLGKLYFSMRILVMVALTLLSRD